MPIREGLARLEGVESISPRPNVKEGTCELRMKDGRLLDPQVLSKFIYDIRVGARLRGLEATVAGFLDKQGHDFILRIAGSDGVLSIMGVHGRNQTSGDRITSYSVDGSTPIVVPPTRGLLNVSVRMDSMHTIGFNSVTQYPLTVDAGTIGAVNRHQGWFIYYNAAPTRGYKSMHCAKVDSKIVSYQST